MNLGILDVVNTDPAAFIVVIGIEISAVERPWTAATDGPEFKTFGLAEAWNTNSDMLVLVNIEPAALVIVHI